MHHVPVHRLQLANIALLRVAIVLRLGVLLNTTSFSTCHHLDLVARSLHTDTVDQLHHLCRRQAVIPSTLILIVLLVGRDRFCSLALCIDLSR